MTTERHALKGTFRAFSVPKGTFRALPRPGVARA